MTDLVFNRAKQGARELSKQCREEISQLFTLRESPPAHSEALPMRADGKREEETHRVELSEEEEEEEDKEEADEDEEGNGGGGGRGSGSHLGIPWRLS